MAYDQDLADRIAATLGPRPGLVERRMFGGWALLHQGNMVCGVLGHELIARAPKTGGGSGRRRRS